MKAIILAGGEGRRLRPLTDKLPKPMIPVMNQPVMAHLLRLLKKHNITEIGVTLGYKSELILEHFKDGEDYGVQLTYFQETEPRGTAGCLKQAASFLHEDFVVICGDIVTDSDLTAAISFHKEKNALATLLLKETEYPLDYGVVVTDADGKIQHFYEQPDWNEVRSDTINTGIYIMKPEILSFIPDHGHYDLAHNLFPALLQKKQPLYGYKTDNYWCDISHIDSYQRCHKDIFMGHVDIGLAADALSKGILIGRDCSIDESVKIKPYTVIGDRTEIGADATVKDCILWSGTVVPKHTELYKTVTCGREMIYTSSQSTFSLPSHVQHRFSGILNDDITPEFIINLASAYVQSIKPNAKILLSLSDDSRYMMPKFAFLSGLMAAGAEVYNLVGAGDRSVAKFALRKLSLDGGIHVQFSDKNVIIELLGANGTPIGNEAAKKVHTVLMTGDYKRINPEKIQKPINVSDMPLYYFKDLITTTPCKRLSFSIGVCAQDSETKNRLMKICSAFGISVLFTNDRDYLPHLIQENKLDFGVLIGENGKCALYDEYGSVLPGDTFYGLVTLIVLSAVEGATVCMPQHVSDITLDIASHLGGEIKRIEDYALETQLLNTNTPAARLQHDLCFDPIRSVIRICEFLFLNRSTLSHITTVLPKMHKIARQVDCPASKKGFVMRKILSLINNKTVDLTEGVKLIDDRGWILIMPDYQKNRMQILSESRDEEYACELAGDMCDLIETMINNE